MFRHSPIQPRNVMRSVTAGIVLLIGVLAACAPARRSDFCANTDMNQLVWEPGFEEAVDDFFGAERGDFYWEGGPVSEQVIAGLGGPPNDLERLRGGMVMGSACRAHSCDERAAVIVQCPSTIVAVGVKHFPCAFEHAGGRCDLIPTFTIFSAPGAPDLARERLEEWARTEWGNAALPPPINHRAPHPRGTDP
jgi:hypothetical protein